MDAAALDHSTRSRALSAPDADAIAFYRPGVTDRDDGHHSVAAPNADAEEGIPKVLERRAFGSAAVAITRSGIVSGHPHDPGPLLSPLKGTSDDAIRELPGSIASPENRAAGWGLPASPQPALYPPSASTGPPYPRFVDPQVHPEDDGEHVRRQPSSSISFRLPQLHHPLPSSVNTNESATRSFDRLSDSGVGSSIFPSPKANSHPPLPHSHSFSLDSSQRPPRPPPPRNNADGTRWSHKGLPQPRYPDPPPPPPIPPPGYRPPPPPDLVDAAVSFIPLTSPVHEAYAHAQGALSPQTPVPRSSFQAQPRPSGQPQASSTNPYQVQLNQRRSQQPSDGKNRDGTGTSALTPMASSHGQMNSTPSLPTRIDRAVRNNPHKAFFQSSSSDSSTRREDYSDSTSEHYTHEDTLPYENQKLFPPRLPTAPDFSSVKDRTQATNRIKTWVSHFGGSQAGFSEPVKRSRPPYVMDELTARSESSDTSQGDLEDEISSLWRELQEHRDNVKDTKNKMAEVRRKLRLLRKQKTDADNNFMNALRPLLVNRITIRRDALSQLESRVLPMQKLRTEYQDLETTYEELEDTLDEKEQLLGWVELRFFSILGTGQGNNGQTPKPMHQRNDVPLELRGISSHRPLEDFHPLFVELTIVIASLQNSKDELHDLLAKRAQYSSEIDPTSVNGIEASRRAQDFLAHFPIQEQKMRDNVRKNEAEFNRLKKICEEKEIMGKHVSIHTDMILHPDKVFEDIELIEVPPSLNGRKTLAHERFSELLSQPDHLLSEPEPLTAFAALKAALALPDDDPRKPGRKRLAVKEISIDRLLQTTPEKESKSEFINRWLLYNLRISPLETIMLYSITSSVFALQDLAIKNLLGWQCDVLYHWPRDDTAHESDMNIEAQEGSDYYMRPRTGSWSHGVSQDSTLREPTV